MDNVATYFVEKTVDNKSISETMSKTNGEVSLEVVVNGDINSGDFMVYDYNSIDNILTVHKNCGPLKTGRMTAVSSTQDTVKINDVRYNVYDNNMTKIDFTEVITSLKAGEDNVQYLIVDEEVIFVQPYKGESSDTNYDFAIITTDTNIMTNIYGKNYNKSLKNGLYIVDGYVAAAGLNLTTGKWEAFYIDGVAIKYDNEEKEFAKVVDVVSFAQWADFTTLAPDKATDYNAAKDVVQTNGIVSVIDVNDNVYTIAEETNLTFVENTNGLIFNDEGRTNPITCDKDVKEARVSTTKDTVIVAVTPNGVYVRTGVQGSRKSIANTATYYSTNANLIVFKTNEVPNNWDTGSSVSTDAAYYVVVPTTAISYDAVAEDEYHIIVSDLFDLRTNDFADVVMIYDAMPKNITYTVGDILYLNSNGELVDNDDTYVTAMTALLGDGWAAADIDFVDHETIGIVDIIDKNKAVSNIDATVVTIDLTDYDWFDYDDSTFYVEELDYVADKYEGVAEINVAGKEKYHYDIVLDTVAEINAPTLGVYTNFDKGVNGTTIYHIENNTYTKLFTSTIHTFANYDEDTNSVDLYIVKVVNAK